MWDTSSGWSKLAESLQQLILGPLVRKLHKFWLKSLNRATFVVTCQLSSRKTGLSSANKLNEVGARCGVATVVGPFPSDPILVLHLRPEAELENILGVWVRQLGANWEEHHSWRMTRCHIWASVRVYPLPEAPTHCGVWGRGFLDAFPLLFSFKWSLQGTPGSAHSEYQDKSFLCCYYSGRTAMSWMPTAEFTLYCSAGPKTVKDAGETSAYMQETPDGKLVTTGS